MIPWSGVKATYIATIRNHAGYLQHSAAVFSTSGVVLLSLFLYLGCVQSPFFSVVVHQSKI